jgi:hypothetical protein
VSLPTARLGGLEGAGKPGWLSGEEEERGPLDGGWTDEREGCCEAELVPSQEKRAGMAAAETGDGDEDRKRR